MDPGLTAIAAFKNLEVLGIRGCDHATDAALAAIATGCTKLKSVDMLNLDYVTAAVVELFCAHCPHLTTLNCEGCNMTGKEYSTAMKRKPLPFASPVNSKCRLEDLPKAVVRHNRYSMAVQNDEVYARMLQKFGRFIVSTYIFRIAKKVRRQELANMKRVFLAFRAGTQKAKKEGIKEKRHYGAVELQHLMRKVYAIHLARRKARVLRKQKHARELLQRAFRGFASRKRTTATFTRLYYYYNLIGHLAHKLVVIKAARRTHRRILCVQGFARMVGPRMRYRRLRYAIRCLQLKLRYYMRKNNVKLRREHLKREEIRLENIRRDKASRFLQRNWKATFFNKTMAPFILTCCIFFRVDYDEKKWNSSMIQRRWRGYIVRLKNYRRTEAFRRCALAAAKIQSIGRMRIMRKRFLPMRRKARKIRKRWLALCVLAMPKLRIGVHVKTMQKYANRFIFIMRRHYASIHIQRIYRGYYYRLKWMLLIYLIHTDKVNKIKRAFYLYKLRKMRRAQINRRHMSSWKIWVSAYLHVNFPCD